MHYGRFAFTKNGKITIKSKRYPMLKLGNRKGLSPGDIDELNRLYKCDGKSMIYCHSRHLPAQN